MAGTKISAFTEDTIQAGDTTPIRRGAGNYAGTIGDQISELEALVSNSSNVTTLGKSGDTTLFVQADKLGVGTATPGETLSVEATGACNISAKSTAGSAIFYADAPSGYDAGYRWCIGGALTYAQFIDDSAGVFRLYDYTNALDIWRYNSSNEELSTAVSKIGFGTPSPDAPLHVYTGNAGTFTASTSYDEMLIEGSGNTGLTIMAPDTGNAGICFSGPSSSGANGAHVWYKENDGILTIGTNNSGVGQIRFRTSDAQEAVRIDENGYLGVGSSNPVAALDVVSGGGWILNSTTNSTLTNKNARFGTRHYDTTEQPVTGLYLSAQDGTNAVDIGGGTSSGNAATRVRFFTAADSTTTTGSTRMLIDEDGFVGIGNSSPSYILDILDSTPASAYFARFTATRDSADALISLRNNGVANNANTVGIDARLLTSVQERSAWRIGGGYTTITDASRVAELAFSVADSSAILPVMTLKGGGAIIMHDLPTSDPSNAGELWNDSGTLKISAG